MDKHNLGAMTLDELLATYGVFEDLGVNRHEMKRLRQNKALRERVARLIKHGWIEDWSHPPYEESPSQRLVRERIPDSFFGINEVQALSLRYTDAELQALWTIPEELLADWKDTDIVFPTFAISYREISRLEVRGQEGVKVYLYDDVQERFHDTKPAVRWMRISTGKAYKSESASAAELALFCLVHDRIRGTLPYKEWVLDNGLHTSDQCQGRHNKQQKFPVAVRIIANLCNQVTLRSTEPSPSVDSGSRRSGGGSSHH